MRSLEVRTAGAGDVAACAELAASRSATKWTMNALRGELSAPGAEFLIAADGPTLLGYAAARAVDEELRLLDFVSAAEGQGVGRALWQELLARGRKRGLKKLTLEVSAENRRARDFYAAAGAVEVGKRPKFYDDGSDAVLMGLTL